MKKALLFLACILIFSVPGRSQSVDLKYHPVPGTAYRLESNMHTVMVQKIMGIDQEIFMDMLMVLDGEIEGVSNGIYRILYRYKKLKISTTSAMFAVEIDTDGEDNEQNNMMSILIDKPFFVFVNELGTITDVEGLESIIDGVNTLADLDSATREQYKISMTESFGRETFMNNMKQVSLPFPDKPVKLGESWTFDYSTTSSNIVLELQNMAVLKEVNRNSALVRINSTMKTPENDTINMNGNNGNIRMSGQQLSEVQIEPSTGLIIESNVSQDIKGRLLFKDSTFSEESMDIPMTMTTKINVTLTHL